MASVADRSERGVQSVLKKLDDAVKAEKYYEAHQIYRTLYFRYMAKKKYTELLQLLVRGALLLLEKDQQASGADLALLTVEVLNKVGTKPDDYWIGALVNLFKLMKPMIPEKDKFLAATTLWSMDGRQHGHPKWHKEIAEIYWNEKDYATAHQHFRLCEDAPLYAKRLVELQNQGNRKDLDTFIARITLQFLVARNYAMAESVYYEYVSQHPTLKDLSGPPFDQYPLLNFIFYLLEAVHSGNTDQFIRLRDSYTSEISRDPDYIKFLDRISISWFSIASPTDRHATPAALFSGILRTLMDPEADSSDEDNNRTPSAVPVPLQNSKLSHRTLDVPELD